MHICLKWITSFMNELLMQWLHNRFSHWTNNDIVTIKGQDNFIFDTDIGYWLTSCLENYKVYLNLNWCIDHLTWH